jgi:hypothetical protein
MRRKSRSLTHTLHLHMAALYARAVPPRLAHRVLRERSMTRVLKSMARAIGSLGTAVRWSLATVDDEPQARVVPLPGPAHGPVAAIDVMREARRRKVTRG